MQAHDGSIQMCSPSGSNNQQGGEGASRTSDNAAKNWSPLTRCCCKPVRAPASGESIQPVHCIEHGRLWFSLQCAWVQASLPTPSPPSSNAHAPPRVPCLL